MALLPGGERVRLPIGDWKPASAASAAAWPAVQPGALGAPEGCGSPGSGSPTPPLIGLVPAPTSAAETAPEGVVGTTPLSDSVPSVPVRLCIGAPAKRPAWAAAARQAGHPHMRK